MSDNADRLRASAGTAKVLGLKDIKSDVDPTTAYLMIGERCSFSCSFCPQGRASDSPARFLSRVSWPAWEQGEVSCRVAAAASDGRLKRACFQVVMSAGASRRVEEAVKELRSRSGVPICVSTSPRDLAEIEEILEWGADRVSLPLDAATSRIYREVKGREWDRSRELLEGAARQYPGRISTHLIVGLGETEEEMVACIQEMRDLGVTVGLFAFTPVRGTPLEDAQPPAIGHYRRVQAAHHLIGMGKVRVEEMRFDAEGRITGFGLEEGQARQLLSNGKAFETSGCEDCNRPYYNERPGGPMYNYPRPLTAEEAAEAIDAAFGE